MKTRLLAITLVAGAGFACTESLDAYWEVRDLRVLAIRAEPPDVLDAPLPSAVRFDALVYDPTDPDGTNLEYTWQFCPIQSGRACRDYDERLEQALDAANQTLAAAGLVVPADIGAIGGAGGSGGSTGAGGSVGIGVCQLSPEVQAGLGGLGTPFADVDGRDYLTDRYRAPAFDASFTLPVGVQAGVLPVPLNFLPALVTIVRACDDSALPADLDLDLLPTTSSDLHLFHLLSNPLESMLGIWTSAVLTVRSGDQTLEAMKRLTLQVAEPAALLELMRVLLPTTDFGIDVCSPNDPTAQDCVRVRHRTANRNPVFIDVGVARGESASGEFQTLRSDLQTAEPPTGAPLDLQRVSVAAGEAIRILPVFAADGEESYQTLNVNLDTQAVEVRDKREEISVSWFVTAGKIQDQITWPKLTKSLDTVYTAPEKVSDEPVRLWMVARDQRGGTTWEQLEIDVVP